MMMGFGLGGLWLIFMLVFWVGVIVLAIWLVGTLFPRVTSGTSLRQPPTGGQYTPPTESPLDILKKRYARGEITKAEYEEMLQDLVD